MALILSAHVTSYENYGFTTDLFFLYPWRLFVYIKDNYAGYLSMQNGQIYRPLEACGVTEPRHATLIR